MGRRYYANSAPQQTLQAAITNSETVVTVTNFTGWPSVPFYATIGMGTISEEIVLVTSISGTTANVDRGQDGTSAIAHSAGETFNQAVIRLDLDEANAHVNATSDIHGVSGALASANDLAAKANTADLGTAATMDVGTGTGTVAAGDDSRITGSTQKSANLSDLSDKALALTNIGGVPASRVITPGTGLTGGGDLSVDRSFAVSYGTTAGTSAQGNDARFVGLATTTQAGTYSLIASDAGTVVEITASVATTVTVPASVFVAGQIIEVCQYGSGQVTLAAGSGITLLSASSLKTRAQYSALSIRFRSATEAVVSGDMA